MSIGQTKNKAPRYSGDKGIFIVLIPCLLLCIVIALVVMFTEYQPPEVKTINIPGEGISTPEITVALELNWGKGDYQVGYADDFVISASAAGKPTCVGPNFFTVDSDESIYLEDIINRRFVKYDSSGQFVGEVSFDRFNIYLPVYIVADYGYLYVVEDDEPTGASVLYRYSFEEDELISIKVHEGKAQVDGIESDGIGNIYVIELVYLSEPEYSCFYKVDSSLSSIREVRKYYSWRYAFQGNGQSIDGWGNIYYVDDSSEHAAVGEDQAIFRFKSNETIEKLYEIPRTESNKLPYLRLLNAFDDGEYFLFYSRYTDGEEVICRINKDGEVLEQFAIPWGYYSYNIQVTKNKSVYFLTPREYTGDDGSPFRLYKFDADE